MNFFLFGGVRVERDDGSGIRLGPKQEQLLVPLILQMGGVVAADVLIDHLWGDDLPTNPLNSLQDVVRRLRDALGDRTRGLVVTVGRGYRLMVDAHSVDVGIFRRFAMAGLGVEAPEPDLSRRLLRRCVEVSAGDLPDVRPDGHAGAEIEDLYLVRDAVKASLARVLPEGADPTDVNHGLERGAVTIPQWPQSHPVGLAMKLSELPPTLLIDIVNVTMGSPGQVRRLREGLLVASFPGAGAALAAASRMVETLPRDPETLLGGAINYVGVGGGRSVERLVRLACRADPRRVLVTASIQRAAIAGRACPPLSQVDDELWQIGPESSGGDERVWNRSSGDGPLIGRENDIAVVTQKIQQGPLVTLRGVGGIGKTRLAREVAERIAAEFADGVSVVDLAEADRSGGALPTVARDLGFLAEPYRPLLATIVGRLAGRRLLLVLDNCEQFVEDVRELCDALANDCVRVRVLATSRVALGTKAETVYDLDGLALDDSSALLVRLAFGDSEAPGEASYDSAALQLCGALEGIPLAIECAAALVRGLGLPATAAMVAELPDGAILPVLDAAYGGRGRHRSIELGLGASHRSLERDDASFFEQLSSLRGSFNADDALSAAPDTTPQLVAARLLRLHEASLLKREAPGRWRMLEPVRQYAATLLLRRGEHAKQTARHGRHFVALAEQAETGLRGPDEPVWFRRVSETYANIDAALSWAVDSGDADAALRLTSALWWYWAARGMFVEGAAAVERALSVDGDAPPPVRAKALVATAHLSWWAGDPRRTESAALTALELFSLGDLADPDVARLDAWARMSVAGARMWGGGVRADLEDKLGQAATLFSAIGDHTGLGIALEVHGGLAWHHGDNDVAYFKSVAALAAFETGGHQTMIAQGQRVLGLAAANLGDVQQGRELVKGGLELSERIGDAGGLPLGLCFLGLVEVLAGRHTEAVDAFASSLVRNRELGQVWAALLALTFAGGYAIGSGHSADGVQLLTAAERLTTDTGIRPPPESLHRAYEALAEATAVLGPDGVASARREGNGLGVADAMSLAIAVLGGQSRSE